MTILAFRGGPRGVGLFVPAAVAAAALGAAAMTVAPPIVVVAGVIAIAGGLAILHDPEWGLLAVAAFTVLRLPDVATDFHGVPSLFTPLVAFVLLAVAVRARATGERPVGGLRALVLFGSFVLTAGSGGSLQALDRASLQSAWTAWLPSHATTPPVVLEDAGLLFVGEQDGMVQAFTLATGGEVWAWQDGSTVSGLASDGRHVYVALASGQVVALDPWSGDEAWRAEMGGALPAGPLTDGSFVLVATEAGEARYLLAETGKEIVEMRLSLGEPIFSAPAPAGGWLFVSSAFGVWAFGPSP